MSVIIQATFYVIETHAEIIVDIFFVILGCFCNVQTVLLPHKKTFKDWLSFSLFIWGFTPLLTLCRSYHDG